MNIILTIISITSMVAQNGVFNNVCKKYLHTREHIFKFNVLFCGVCAFCMNYINMKLSGILPSQLFFPLVNGSAIVLSSLVSIFFFKEMPTQKQVVGLCGGILSLILICVVK